MGKEVVTIIAQQPWSLPQVKAILMGQSDLELEATEISLIVLQADEDLPRMISDGQGRRVENKAYFWPGRPQVDVDIDCEDEEWHRLLLYYTDIDLVKKILMTLATDMEMQMVTDLGEIIPVRFLMDKLKADPTWEWKRLR